MYVYVCTFQTFDRYRCTQLVMECLCKFEDDAICRMSLAVISILAAKVSYLSVKYFVELLGLVGIEKIGLGTGWPENVVFAVYYWVIKFNRFVPDLANNLWRFFF